MTTRILALVGFVILLCMPSAWAADGVLPAVTVTTGPDGSTEYSVTMQILLLMTSLSFLPAMLIMLTSFTRIIIVLSILRQAIGLQQTPSNQVLIGMSLFMTFFIMAPVFDRIYDEGVKPYIEEQLTLQQAFEKGKEPIRSFMLGQVRTTDLKTFIEISGYKNIKSPEEAPMSVLIPAFITSELKTAFQIGFMLFVPFLVLDLVVASILMAMGMMMLSPMIVSLPFKIMLFVLVDGWSLVLGTLANSFG
ncbi:MAG: flagellar type III secretion system pore protein FliP [Gammaproteobacteria bacterium]|uniref:flagellar type III secretion system pore protein FliP n=1 Tax=Shewanella TaxID=22 RepID=UPI000CA0AA7E|nr:MULTISPECIES: flagellar type III secretion system pore protein FliP [Shewanella]MBU1390991.1 flagellar type III secretion system pore protein FliP [Gammaproteobacteria bacterium]AUD61060.1 flagellar biosynthetic protein FliP [Shewanella sp. Pdp11]MBU1479159.1 flagellar type III secretion system pore protein FliP [Gammaproteobacteria bacterium]MBU2003111.1 flagellar type III secretion system pore protein FliP [Gammaproteobacteria bacterium]MBU2134307.1 flagellar type III secretion system por